MISLSMPATRASIRSGKLVRSQTASAEFGFVMPVVVNDNERW